MHLLPTGEMHLMNNYMQELKVKGWKKIVQANGKERQDNTNFNIKKC